MVVVSELELKRTQMIWEMNKLCEAEAKLHQSEREQAKLRQQQAKLQIRNQETLEELEKGTIKTTVNINFAPFNNLL